MPAGLVALHQSTCILIRGLLLYLPRKTLICIPENKYTNVCRLSHLCFEQVMRIPIYCDTATTDISNMWCCDGIFRLNTEPSLHIVEFYSYFNFVYKAAKCVWGCIWPNKMFLLATLGQSAAGWAWLHFMTCIWNFTVNLNNLNHWGTKILLQ